MAKNNERRDYGSGSVSQRKDGTWTARMIIGKTESGKPKIKALYGQTEREVKKKLKDFTTEFNKNNQVVVKRNTVETYMRDWLESNKKNTLKPKSYDRLEQTIENQVLPLIGHIQIAALEPRDVQQMINDLKSKGYSRSSIKKAYDAVNECFRTGTIQRALVYNPALGVTIPSINSFEERELHYYTREEADDLISSATSVYGNGNRIYRLGDVVALDLNTGLRLAELLALKWADIDIEGKNLLVRDTRVVVKDRTDSEKKYITIEQKSTKTASGYRTVELNDAAISALSSLKEITGNSVYVLATKDGEPVSQRYLDRMLRNIATFAKFPKERVYGFHSLRHTFASLLFADGIDVKTVSELLGHSDVTITYNIYIHIILIIILNCPHKDIN